MKKKRDFPETGGSAKNPGREFLMDCEKDKNGKFERGYLKSNHRKVTGFGLSQDAKRPIAIFGTAARIQIQENSFFFLVVFCCKSNFGYYINKNLQEKIHDCSSDVQSDS